MALNFHPWPFLSWTLSQNPNQSSTYFVIWPSCHKKASILPKTLSILNYELGTAFSHMPSTIIPYKTHPNSHFPSETLRSPNPFGKCTKLGQFSTFHDRSQPLHQMPKSHEQHPFHLPFISCSHWFHPKFPNSHHTCFENHLKWPINLHFSWDLSARPSPQPIPPYILDLWHILIWLE